MKKIIIYMTVASM